MPPWPDISPATPLDELPKRSQKGWLYTSWFRDASNLYSRQFNTEEFSRMYLYTVPAGLHSESGVLNFSWMLVDVVWMWCDPRYHSEETPHRDQSSSAISKPNQYDGKLLSSILDSRKSESDSESRFGIGTFSPLGVISSGNPPVNFSRFQWMPNICPLDETRAISARKGQFSTTLRGVGVALCTWGSIL